MLTGRGRGRELCRHLGSGRRGEAENVGMVGDTTGKRSYKDLSEMGCHTTESTSSVCLSTEQPQKGGSGGQCGGHGNSPR